MIARLWRRSVHAFVALALRRRRAIVVTGLVALLGSVLLGVAHGVSIPFVHDEHGHLLAGDTFARGRWTNPSPEVWEPFESIHIIVRPSYMSKYPPGQGLFLALGYRLGHPILGVWVSLALACAALCWMLQGWLPPRWALVGALLGTARLTFGTDSLLEGGGDPYWGTSYWGGAVAMLGGCLLLGAYPRLRAGPRVRDAVWMGVGLVLLANTRPYEGLALCLPVGGALAAWVLGRHRPPLRVLLLRVGLPLLAVLVPAALLMMEYNRRVTGDPLLLPYLSHGQQYEPVPVVLFLPERPEPVYRHKSIRDLHAVWAVDVYRRQQTLGGWANEAGEKLLRMWSFYLGPTLSVPFLALPWVLCRRGVPLALAGVGAVVAAQVVVGTWSYNHYSAPATGLVFFLVAACLRRLAGWRAGRVLVGLVLLSGWVVLPVAGVLQFGHDRSEEFYFRRARLIERLAAEGDRHLVLVHYGPDHDAHQEWVYNEADLDEAAVVFARDMEEADPAVHARLLRHFSGRRLWRLYADEDPPRLEQASRERERPE